LSAVRRAMARVAPIVGLAVLVGATALGRSDLAALAPERRTSEDLLYLPNGRYLQAASLGHASLLADLVYIWAIQYYSDYEREDRYRYVEHVFGDVITRLDPHYVDAYWLGAVILSVEANDLQGALRLLDKGMQANPDNWILPYLAGWECYHARDMRRAAEYFSRATAVSGAPPAVRRMQAGALSRAGDLRDAIALWQAVRDDPASDEASRTIARHQLRTLAQQLDVETLGQAAARFRNDNGAWPRSLETLVRRGYISRVPSDPWGRPYRYDPASGRITASSGRVLKAR